MTARNVCAAPGLPPRAFIGNRERMHMNGMTIVATAFGLALAAFAASPAAAQAACKEIAAPAIITEGGCYRLREDYRTEDSAQPGITITADDVAFDLGGHLIQGAGAGSLASGVNAIGAGNLSIRNGRLTGFLYGVRIEPAADDPVDSATVENLTIESGTAQGIYVTADTVKIADNIVRNLSGYLGWPGSYTVGIEISARICEVTGNELTEIYPEGVGEAVAISMTDATDRCSIEGNVIANDGRRSMGAASAFGSHRSSAISRPQQCASQTISWTALHTGSWLPCRYGTWFATIVSWSNADPRT